jgi:hypothetical protein
LEVLASRGHDLSALLHDYPMDLVLNLHRAAMENRKEELKGRVLGLAVAVMNALDAAFNQGRGKILENWLKAVDNPEESRKRESSRRLSPGALAFFSGLPRSRKD